jgi:hypothetical protein
MSAPDSILQLVDNFETHRRAYLSQDYNEAQIDALVYELYRLTEGEIRLVEGKSTEAGQDLHSRQGSEG